MSCLGSLLTPKCPNTVATPNFICANRFIGFLNNQFNDRRLALLSARESRSFEYDGGALPQYPLETAQTVRANNSWRCAPPPADIADRRVEITGPVDRKMVINGLNSGASTYMAGEE